MRKYENPRSKVRARPDCNSMEATIPEKIVYGYRLKPKDQIEWILCNEGSNEYVKVIKVQS